MLMLYARSSDFGKPRAWYWYPKLYETVVYSEVLNKVRTRQAKEC